MKTLLGFFLLLAFAGATAAAESGFPGTYKNAIATVELRETSPGQFAGTIASGGETTSFAARESGGALVGTVVDEDETIEFRFALQGSTLVFTAGGESQTFLRQGGESSRAEKAASTTSAPDASSKPLRVNRVALPEEDVRRFEKESGMRLPRGDFWYDPVSGAWGLEGGPTAGFTFPGMRLGGPLPQDASRGNTGVFINGRELPMQDVAGLQQMQVPVQQGRWWIDSQGNFGVEGVPVAMGNIFQFSRGRGGAYQRATAGGYIGGDGQTSYFFDPSTGASVMTGE